MTQLHTELSMAWGATRPITRAADIALIPRKGHADETTMPWTRTRDRHTPVTSLAWGKPARLTQAVDVNWGRAAPLTRAYSSAQAEYPQRTRATTMTWAEHLRHHSRHVDLAWIQGYPLTRSELLAWVDVLRIRPGIRPLPPPCYAPPPHDAVIFDRDCSYIPPGSALEIDRDRRDPYPMPLPRALDVHNDLVWRQGEPVTRSTLIVWGPVWSVYPNIQIDIEDGWETEIEREYITIRDVYMISHNIFLTRVSDGANIPFSAASITSDAHTWADVFTATVHGDDSMELLTDTVGTEIELSLDNDVWRFIVDQSGTKETLAHGNRVVKLLAHSLTSLLHTPHSDPQDYSEASARTVAQLATDRLPGGWTLIWDVGRPVDPPIDWLVPGGVWQYRNLTPIQAIASIAASIGASINPDPIAHTITIRSYYPVLPWDYASSIPNLTIPDGIWLSVQRRPVRPVQANAVHVTGGSVSGVQGRVYRSPTAGDAYADSPSAQDLMTHQDGVREYGSMILASQAQSSQILSITIPYDGNVDWPLINVGDLLLIERYGGQRDTVQSRTVSLSISGNSVDVTQTALLGSGGGTPYTRLRRVTSDTQPLLLATIVQTHGDGTSTVSYPSGGNERVIGTGSGTVWVRSGKIEGQAPSMPSYDLPV